jgi:hypothetical protein
MDFINSIVMIVSFKFVQLNAQTYQYCGINNLAISTIIAWYSWWPIIWQKAYRSYIWTQHFANTTWKSYNLMNGLTKKVNAKLHNHWNSYDLCSMIKMTSTSGAHYFMTFINNYNHYTWVYFLKFKSQAY